MADNYVSFQEENGSINISEDVVIGVVRAIIEEADGVKGLGGVVPTEITERISKKPVSKGIKIRFTDDQLIVDATILVSYGKNIMDVAKNVQDRVYDALSSVTGAAKAEVNIHVSGIAFDK